MKKIITLFLILVISSQSFTQGEFNKLEDTEGISTLVVTKDVFDLLKKFPNTNSEYLKIFNIVKGIQELKVFSTKKNSTNLKMEKMIFKAIKNEKMSQLIKLKKNNEIINIYVKTSNNKENINKIIMLIKQVKNQKNELNTNIISILGNISTKDLINLSTYFKNKKL